MSSVQCPKCEAAIAPPAGRKVTVTQCPWCGADVRAEEEPPAPEASAVPKHREVRESHAEDGGRPFLALTILVVCAAIAVGAFFLTRHLTSAAG